MKRQKVTYKKLSGKESDESGEETELFVRKSSPYKEIPTIEKLVQEGDTLQAISIRYHCSIAELKRLNNIHRENEIYARTKVKVPARHFSLSIPGVHDSGNNSPNENITADLIDNKLLKNKLIETSEEVNSQINAVNEVIFNSNLVVNNKRNDVEDVSAETDVLIPPHSEIQQSCWLSCSGADADISWIGLLILALILIVAAPIIYVLYIYEHPEEYRHKHHINIS